MVSNLAPDADTVELSLFGNGAGECIVIHIGDGDWVVVDSLRDEAGNPVAATYLSSIDVDIHDQIPLIVCTHWHDDHCDGIVDLYREADNAKIAVSSAMIAEEFMALIEFSRGIPDISGSSGVREMGELLSELQSRHNAGHPAAPQFLASEGKRLLDKSRAGKLSLVECLSPGSQCEIEARERFADLVKELPDRGRRCRTPDQNDVSVAIRVTFAGGSLLLGADLPNGSTERHGWRAVVASNLSFEKSAIVKVPHHGSKTSNLDDVWKLLASEQPLAAVTPYARSRLPQADQVTLLKSRSRSLFSTCPPNLKRPARRPRAEKLINQSAKNRVSALRVPGHIRMRWNREESPLKASIELVGDAVQL